MKTTDKQKEILGLTNTDCLLEAEKITGKSYKESDSTSYLGMGLQFAKSKMLSEKLDEIGDTKFSETVKSYISKLSNFGFNVVYKESFSRKNEIKENLYFLFNKDLGVLIKFDTHTWEKGEEPNVNGGSMFYNWSPNDLYSRSTETSSGGFVYDTEQKHVQLFNKDFKGKHTIENYPKDLKITSFEEKPYKEYRENQKPIEEEQKRLIKEAFKNGKRCVWSGDHDCREAVITNLTLLMEKGTLLTKWVENPSYWLKDNIKDISPKLPKEVIDCINNTY